MKRYITLSIILMMTSTFALGQEFLLGAKVGVQAYGMHFGDKDLKDTFSSGIGFGYTTGIVVNFPLPANFGLATEFNYSKKGRRVNFNSGEWTNAGRYTFYEIPVLLRKYFDISGQDYTAKWYVNVGPNISYWSGGKGKIITNGPGLEYSMVFADSAEYDLTTMYMVDANRWIFGLDVGIGFMAWVLNNQRFFVEGRFSYGHTYLGQSDSANLYILGFEDDMRTSYRLFNISAGYAIHLDVRDTKKGKSTVKKRKRY